MRGGVGRQMAREKFLGKKKKKNLINWDRDSHQINPKEGIFEGIGEKIII